MDKNVNQSYNSCRSTAQFELLHIHFCPWIYQKLTPNQNKINSNHISHGSYQVYEDHACHNSASQPVQQSYKTKGIESFGEENLNVPEPADPKNPKYLYSCTPCLPPFISQLYKKNTAIIELKAPSGQF